MINFELLTYFPPSNFAAYREVLRSPLDRKADNVRIVGNIAQEEIPEEVNFLVKLEPGRSLLDQGGLLIELQELLGYELYVTVEGGLKGEYRQRVLQEAVAL
ncbi:MAG: nucleotidyltransferase [Hormoscilla sp.]